MLQHVYERVSLARYLTNVIIATDDERIRDEAASPLWLNVHGSGVLLCGLA